jgi:enoyl-CoA hydratase/carnithine racemase
VFTGRKLDVAEADRLGLVDRRVPAGADREVALELAAVIAANSPVGVRNAKRALRQGADVDLATGLDVEDGAWRATAFSADRAEGVAAFNEKRRPDWPGR